MSLKFEGKYDEGVCSAGSKCDPAEYGINVTAIQAEPNNCALQDELNLVITYESAENIRNAIWSVQYMVDSVHKRHIVKLGTVEERVSAGINTFIFHVDKIDVSGVKPSRLANVGLLSATLSTKEGNEVITINIVVQVTKDTLVEGKMSDEGPGTPTFIRTIFNPLE